MQTVAIQARYTRVALIVPCLNEEAAIGPMVTAVRALGIATVIVVDGHSTDATVANASAAGATVIIEPQPGYGRAIQTGLASLPLSADIILFMDGDGSDRPENVPVVLLPLLDGTADFVHGTRLSGAREAGALSVPQVIAGHTAGWLIRVFYGVRFTDMSPFRAITREALSRLGMTDETFGWNLEMQMRVAALGLRVVEVPVGQRQRQGGVSKVSGNVRVALKAAWVIAATFFRLAVTLRRTPVEDVR
jgi:glycosyltransferase involved in cell wall biosynthesis